jgi:predicted nucleic acid-binding protein
MSADRCFFDTNIFLYSVDRSDARKQAIADALTRDALYRANGTVSYQVVQEFVNASLKKFPGTMTGEESFEYLRETFADDCDRVLL